MREVQVTSMEAITSILFDVETAIYEANYSPLKSHLNIQTSLSAIKTIISDCSALLPLYQRLMMDVDSVIEQGQFFNESQMSCLLAWVSEFRSIYVSESSFETPIETSLLEGVQQKLQAFLAQPQCSVQSYKGEFYGQIPQGFEDFVVLSDLGYWVIDHAENRSAVPYESLDTVHMQVVLETGLHFEQLSARLPNWRWTILEQGANQALLLPEESSNYWVDWLHLLASEREVWRRSASFLRFYKSLHDQVREQFSQALDDVFTLTHKTHLRVVPLDSPSSKVHDLNLYGGRVFLLDANKQPLQVIPLAESVIPVYCLAFQDCQLVFPAFRATVCDVTSVALSESLNVWHYSNGVWHQDSYHADAGPLLEIKGDHEPYFLQPQSITRDYGVVLKATFLPKSIHNFWLVRGAFLAEPMLPDEAFAKSYALRQESCFVRSSQKKYTPIMFQLTPSHGMELYSDMVIGLTPYRSANFLMPGFVYHCGRVWPLLEAEETLADDMVAFVESRGVHFAFRGQYSNDKETIHRLVDAEAIVLNWQDGQIQLSIQKDGWFLLDQGHTYFFLKQLLEILE